LSFGDSEEAIDDAFEELAQLVQAAQSQLPLWQPFALKAERQSQGDFTGDPT